MHVDDKNGGISDLGLIEGVDLATQHEVLRRMSEINSCNVNPQSFNNESEIKTLGQCRDDDADSWDEFDKVIEKRMPAKELELHEFEDLAQQSLLHESVPQEEDQFMSTEEAKQELDRDEELRAQFLQSKDATFLSQYNASSILDLGDPLSISNYFKSRSSFPVDNCANDSTMLGDKTVNGRTLLGMLDPVDDYSNEFDNDTDKTILGLDSISLGKCFDSAPQEKKENNKLSEIIPESAKSIQKFMLSSLSNGKTVDEITEYILQACRGSIGYRKTGSVNMPVVAENDKLQKSSSASSQTPGIPRPVPRISTAAPINASEKKMAEPSTNKTSSRSVLNKPVDRHTKVSFAPQLLNGQQSSSTRSQAKEMSQPSMKVSERRVKEARTITTSNSSGLNKPAERTTKVSFAPQLLNGQKKSSTTILANGMSQSQPPTNVAERKIKESSRDTTTNNSSGLSKPIECNTKVSLAPERLHETKSSSTSSQTRRIPRPLPKTSTPMKVSERKVKESSTNTTICASGTNKPPECNIKNSFVPHVLSGHNPAIAQPHPEVYGPNQSSFGGPLSIHIHIPAFHPGMMYSYPAYGPPPQGQSYQHPNSTQQPHHSNLPFIYPQPSGQK